MNATIYLVTQIQSVTLIVFHTEARCWQFQIAITDDLVFVDDSIHYSRESAEQAGRDWIAQLRHRTY